MKFEIEISEKVLNDIGDVIEETSPRPLNYEQLIKDLFILDPIYDFSNKVKVKRIV